MGKPRNKEVGNPSTTSEKPPSQKKKTKSLKAVKKIAKNSSKGNSEISEKVNTEDRKNSSKGSSEISEKVTNEDRKISSKGSSEISEKVTNEDRKISSKGSSEISEKVTNDDKKISSKGSSEISEKVTNDDRNTIKDIAIKVDGSTQVNEHREANSKETEANTKETIGGLIFMCNSKTKPDCFDYKVMGLPENKREFVFRIKPGMKLFLYDFNSKLLYGIFKASSYGGMQLEPAAFNGLYPAQVRFEVERACTPLPYDIFKHAIKDNLTGVRNMFKVELSIDQVVGLCILFPSVLAQQPIINKDAFVPKPVQVPAPAPAPAPTPVSVLWPANLPSNGPHPPPSFRREIVRAPISSSRSLNEQEYIHFGLNRNPFSAHPATPPHGNVSDAYIYHPYRASGLYESKINYQNDPSQPAPYVRLPYDLPRTSSNFELGASRDVRLGETFPIGRPNTRSDYNRNSLSVSARYSFAGPSMSYK